MKRGMRDAWHWHNPHIHSMIKWRQQKWMYQRFKANYTVIMQQYIGWQQPFNALARSEMMLFNDKTPDVHLLFIMPHNPHEEKHCYLAQYASRALYRRNILVDLYAQIGFPPAGSLSLFIILWPILRVMWIECVLFVIRFDGRDVSIWCWSI